VRKVKAVNNLIYGNLTRKTTFTIDFQTKITPVKHEIRDFSSHTHKEKH